MNQTRPCPLCESVDATLLTTMSAEQIISSSSYYDDSAYQKLGVAKTDTFGVSQCNNCDFVFSTSVPSNDFLSLLYESDQLEDSVQTFARPSRAAYAYKSLSTLLTAMSELGQTDAQGRATKKPHILDVGCAYGVGSLGLTMQHYPYKIYGVEWSKVTRDYLSKQGMITYKNINDIPNELSFDGILLNDVLEHVPEPVIFLEKLRQLSHANTAIWVNVPNFIDWRLRSIIEQVSTKNMNVAKDFNPWEHLSYFSPQSLDRMMLKIGAKRRAYDQIDYSVSRADSSLKTLLKFFRDLRRIRNNSYLNTTTTAAIYTFN